MALHPVDAFLDMVVEHGTKVRWRTTISNHRPEYAEKLGRSPGVQIGFSDAGAHLRNMAFYNFGLRFLRRVRDAEAAGRPFMSVEHAVHRLTGELADWYAVDAGHLREGDRADLVVIDPARLDESLDAYAEAPVEQYDRLPRMVNRNDAAVIAVLVNGEHVFGRGRAAARRWAPGAPASSSARAGLTVATVLLTGASGFLGVHTMRSLLEAGHRVRAFVRTPARLREEPAAARHRARGLPHRGRRGRHDQHLGGPHRGVGLRRGHPRGGDVLVQAPGPASGWSARTAEGTRTVLEAGAEAGASVAGARVVHGRAGPARAVRCIDHTSPLGTGPGPYAASKVASEAVARELQDAGAPVTIVNPGGMVGPHDPYLGENNEVMAQVLQRPDPGVAARLACSTSTCATSPRCSPPRSADEPGGRYLVPGHNVPGLAPRPADGDRAAAAGPDPAGRRCWSRSAMPGYLTGWRFLPGAVEGIRIVALREPGRRLGHHRGAGRRGAAAGGVRAGHDPVARRDRAPRAEARRAARSS